MSTYKNKVLQNLCPDAIARLHLKPVVLELGHEIEYPGSSIGHIFFIEAGMGSMTCTFSDGSQIEVGMFGYQSVVGISALMGTKKSLNRIYMQMPGSGYMVPVDTAKAEFARGDDFQRLALRYVQAQLTQATQSAACNAKHNVEQRLARWLLLCSDRAESNVFSISQQSLADMLGVARPSVSVIAAEFKKQGLIEYKRNEIYIPSTEALQKRACECYLVIKHHLENYAEFDTGFVV
jgi:CRP-like cAMP-binding protein